MKLRRLFLGRKAMTNSDSTLKNRDITLPTKVHLVKALVFPVVMYGCESWTIKKAECCRTDIFELWCWRRLLRVPWTARRSNQSVLKEIKPDYSLEELMLKLKLQYFGTWCEEPTHLKRPWCWERLKAGGEGDDRGQDGWMPSLTQCAWVWASSRDGEGQGSLVWCSPRGHKESDTTNQLNIIRILNTFLHRNISKCNFWGAKWIKWPFNELVRSITTNSSIQNAFWVKPID